MKQAPRLYRIEGFADLWADACLRSDEGQLRFLSFYGRDSSIMQFISAMELGAKAAEGIQRFHLVQGASRHLVEVGSVEGMGKFSTRLPRQNLFGPVSQMWIYDKSLQEIDKANRIGWVIHHEQQSHRADADRLDAQVWELVKNLSPVALLDHWREPLIEWCLDRKAVQEIGSDLYPRLGPIRGVRVSLSDYFLEHVSHCVRQGAITLTSI